MYDECYLKSLYLSRKFLSVVTSIRPFLDQRRPIEINHFSKKRNKKTKKVVFGKGRGGQEKRKKEFFGGWSSFRRIIVGGTTNCRRVGIGLMILSQTRWSCESWFLTLG